MFKTIAFELLNFFLIVIKKLSMFKKLSKLDLDNSKLRQDGVESMGKLLTKKQCQDLRSRIDALIDNPNVKVWRDPEGSDERIFFADKVDLAFKELYESKIIRDKLVSYTGTREPVGMLLAAKLSPLKNNLGSGGGWHRDSPFRTQFKSLCYLNNVTEVGGPFQIIKGSHKMISVILASLKSLLRPGEYRFSEKTIKSYINTTNHFSSDILGSEGDFFAVDTKAIHRGKPILEGTRYVLFWYFWDGELPAHIAALSQDSTIDD